MLGSWQPQCTHELPGTLTLCQAQCSTERHPPRVPIPIFLLDSSHLDSILLQEGGAGYCRRAICSSALLPRHVQEGAGSLQPSTMEKAKKRAGFAVQQR